MTGTDFLERLRRVCLELPGAVETETWGHANFRAGKKIFALLGDHEGAPALVVKAAPGAQEMLVGDPRFFVPPYVGHKGWVGVRVSSALPLALVEDLVEDSYRLVAGKRMLAELDAREARPRGRRPR